MIVERVGNQSRSIRLLLEMSYSKLDETENNFTDQITEEFKNGVDEFIKIAKRDPKVADVLGRNPPQHLPFPGILFAFLVVLHIFDLDFYIRSCELLCCLILFSFDPFSSTHRC